MLNAIKQQLKEQAILASWLNKNLIFGSNVQPSNLHCYASHHYTTMNCNFIVLKYYPEIEIDRLPMLHPGFMFEKYKCYYIGYT